MGVGGGDALLTTMSNSAFMGTLSSVMNTGVGHVTSHDENDDVFSPCSTDDEHMKHIEKVCLCWEQWEDHVHMYMTFMYMYM